MNGDPYALYVLGAWGATVAIVGWIVFTTLRANARARDDLETLEKDRKR